MATTAAVAAAPARALTIQQVARRTGLARSTLRYYEQIGLIPPVERDPDSGHRRFGPQVVETLEALSCLRGAGVPIDEMRRYLALLAPGDLAAAAEEAALFAAHADRVEAEIARLGIRLEYLRAKADLWQARVDGDADSERRATDRTLSAMSRF
ncbi:MerR family transcriptional regulator [Promicromonospora sukumoe]|uniref:MerR family transcriptional regulator n=1 Tax=Promicromonospora sukumoe TaxID=88382 RepID=UPI00037D7B58|nr:MerR family transcriptional regulator [Promicromonospora sukumoe]